MDATQVQAREAARTDTGQFGPQARSNPGTNVLGGLWADHGGSFEFPPVLTTFDQVVQFWSTVEVPDEALRSFETAWWSRQAAARDELERQYMTDHYWDAQKDREATRAQAEVFAREQLAARVRPVLRAEDVRPLARLVKMVGSARRLPVEQEQRLWQTLVLEPGTSTPTTVKALVDAYDAMPLEEALADARSQSALESVHAKRTYGFSH